jgi:hypothetical protein
MKIQCPNIKIGENVHKHYCRCCEGKQHISFAKALKYKLRGLLVLTADGRDATDCEIHNRIENYIELYKSKHGYNGRIEFERKCYQEPISTLNACIETIRFYDA